MAENDTSAGTPARRRSFVASGAKPPDPPPPPPPQAVAVEEPPQGVPAPEAATEEPQDFDDLPVLTDVVVSLGETEPAEPVPPPEPVIPDELIAARAAELIQARLPDQRQALADELASWLDRELPLIVMRVLDGTTDQIIAQVTAEARAALLPRIQEVLELDPIAQDGTD